MQKLISTLITIIFFQTQVFSFPIFSNSFPFLYFSKTDIKGAVIANAEVGYDSDGKIAFRNDKGNLKFITKELEYSDIKDNNVNESNGFNIGLNIGVGTDKQTATKYPKGSLNIGATASGQEREQQTKATIGNGKIIVDGKNIDDIINLENYSLINFADSSSSALPADSSSSVIPAEQLGGNLSKLNRDITTTQELTKNETTRALNINTTIDLRLLTKEGRKDILTAIKNAPKNINQIGKNITKNNIVVQSVKNAITDEDINIIEAVKDYIKTDKQIRKIQSNKETTETLNGATNYSVEDITNALQEVADISLIDESLDYKNNTEVTVYNNESGLNENKGYSYIGKDGIKIGLNTETMDITNSGDIINTMYHEATHINKGTSEKTATNYGDTAQSIWDMYNFGNENTNIITGEQWNEKNRTDIGFIEGNNIAITNYTNSKLGLGIFNERWIYSQKYGNTYYKNEETGEIKLVASDGYAGHGTGVNNPDMQHVGTKNIIDEEEGVPKEERTNVGPLPEGIYTIGEPYIHDRFGAHTLNLTPDANNEMYGRNLFRIHGDRKNNNGNREASTGCIILEPKYRKQISSSGDNVLEVKRGDGIIDKRYTIVGANRIGVTNYIDSKKGLSTDKYEYSISNPLDYGNETTYISPGLNRPNTQNFGASVYVPTRINTVAESYYNTPTPTLNLYSSPYANVETYLNELFRNLNDR